MVLYGVLGILFVLFNLLHLVLVGAYHPYCSLYISCGTDEEIVAIVSFFSLVSFPFTS